jgi:hypothetical protein
MPVLDAKMTEDASHRAPFKRPPMLYRVTIQALDEEGRDVAGEGSYSIASREQIMDPTFPLLLLEVADMQRTALPPPPQPPLIVMTTFPEHPASEHPKKAPA